MLGKLVSAFTKAVKRFFTGLMRDTSRVRGIVRDDEVVVRGGETIAPTKGDNHTPVRTSSLRDDVIAGMNNGRRFF